MAENKRLAATILIPTALGLLAGTIASFSFIGALAIILITIPTLLIWTIYLVIRLLMAAWRCRWREIPRRLFTYAAAMLLIFFGLYRGGDDMHFLIMLPSYIAQLAARPADRPMAFKWESQGLIVGTDRMVVYDPTDSQGPLGSHYFSIEDTNEPLSQQIRNDEAGFTSTRRLIGHFYLIKTTLP